MVERRIALLMPVYNDQEGLIRSLESLPEEVPLDIVVVDDGSTPPIRLPKVSAPHRVFLLRLEKNQGITGAMNHGLRWILERGYEYIARLDAGDIALPGRFLSQLRFLEENPEYALVGGQAYFVDTQGKEVFRYRVPTDHESIRRTMHTRMSFIHPAVMFRASVLKEVGLYSDRYMAAEDYEFFFRVMRRFKVANLPEYVVKYEINPKGISATKRRAMRLNALKIVLKNFDPKLKESWLGLAVRLLMLLLPPRVALALKRLGNRQGWL